MSRWDALRKSSDPRHPNPSRPPSASLSSRCSAEDAPPRSSVPARATRRPRPTAHVLGRELAAQYQQRPADATVEALVTALDELVADHDNDCHAGQVAELWVRNVLLHHLQQRIPSRHCQRQVLRGFERLLPSSCHATAILAPLVVDVAEDGQEQLQVNPVRIDWFRTLQQQLLCQESWEDGIADMACRILTKSLHLAFRMERTRRHAASSSLDIETQTMQALMSRWLPQRNSARNRLALQLLQAFLTRHPYAAPSLTMPLFEPSRLLEEANCHCCGNPYKSLLIQYLHGDNDATVTSCANECTALLMEHSPLDLWLMNPQGATIPVAVRSTAHTFFDRVSQALENVVRATCCQLPPHASSMSSSTKTLIVAILTSVPFQQAHSLRQATVSLVETLCHLCISTQLAPSQDAAMAMAATDCLLAACGGSITPRGERVPMSLVLREWLNDRKGRLFLQTYVAQLPSGAAVARNYTLVGALLRSYPALVVGDADMARTLAISVRECFLSSSTSDKARARCMGMVQSLMQGRLDDSDQSGLLDMFPTVWLAPFLLTMVQGQHSESIQVACMTYGSMGPCDWLQWLDSGEKVDVLAEFQAVIQICLDGMNSKLRSEAWKSLGHMLTHFYDRALQYHASLWRSVLAQVAPILCRPANDPSEQAMQLFALGNMVEALKDPMLHGLAERPMLDEFAHAARGGLCSDNDKVLSNAMRAAAQTFSLLSGLRVAFIGFNEVIFALNQRIVASFEPAGYGIQSLSWKQRSAVRKLAWGACNALKVAFDSGLACDSSLREPVKECLSSLGSVIQQSHRLQEKIVVCAVVALRSVDLSMHLDYEQDNAVGKCLSACIQCLFGDDDTRVINSKLRTELELLLVHLVHQSSVSNFVCALATTSATTNSNAFFDWIATNNKTISATHFHKIALAMQLSEIPFDVEIEQVFASRSVDAAINMLDEEI